MANCKVCNEIIISEIDQFKEQFCTHCEQFNEECRGASETVTMCKECCQDDFIEQDNANSRAFYGVMVNHNEDREESDLQIGKG